MLKSKRLRTFKLNQVTTMEEGTEIPKTLMDAEHQEQMKNAEERAVKLSKVAREIEAILIREDMTYGDWGEIVELFSARIGNFVARIKINFPKN